MINILRNLSLTTYIRIIWNYLNVSHREDSNSSVSLSLIPIVVNLFLDVDHVSLPEAQFTSVLSLEVEECLGYQLTVSRLLASVEKQSLVTIGVLLLISVERNW